MRELTFDQKKIVATIAQEPAKLSRRQWTKRLDPYLHDSARSGGNRDQFLKPALGPEMPVLLGPQPVGEPIGRQLDVAIG
jgi:hypothetical protein